MKTIKKLMLAAVVAMVGLCGTAWADIVDSDGCQFNTETGEIIGYAGAGGDVVIPAQIGSVDVKAISEAAFRQKALTSVTIPAGVTNIGAFAFAECSSLTGVTFSTGSQLGFIGNFSFLGTGLTSVTIPASVANIGESAFRSCPGLMSVSFAESSQLKSIGITAFADCEKLVSVTLPAGCPLENINQNAFRETSLTSITIPAGVTNIGDSVFYRCSGLASVTFEDGSQLKTMGNEVFENCTALTDITIPAGVTTIGMEAFNGCRSMASVTFAPGSQLKEIGECMFLNGSSLTEVTIPASVTNIGQGAFAQCSSLTSVTFEADSQLKGIGGSVFYGCPLTGIPLPEGLTDIRSTAFHLCTNLTTVTLPASVTSVGQGAFFMCSNLTEVTVLATTPPTAGDKMFDADMTGTPIATLKAIKVPAASVEDYKKAAGWLPYANLITDGTIETTYYAWNGTKVAGPLTTNAIPVTADMTTLESGWYVVTNKVVIVRPEVDQPEEEEEVLLSKPGLEVNGDVHLILADGAELVVTGSYCRAGIEVVVVGSTTNSLTIYGQENQTGKLTAVGGKFAAGIGGNDDQSCGLVTIDGGIVAASVKEGSYAAGIGGGAGCCGGTVTINGGNVTATGALAGAGIGGGGGEYGVEMPGGSVVIINGGTVTANSSNGGAGIGGGQSSGDGTVTINGGTVTANGGAMSAGIGSGAYWGEAWTVTINGGTVKATSYGEIYEDEGGATGIFGGGGAGIGSGAVSAGGVVTINGGEVIAISHPIEQGDEHYQGEGIGAGIMAAMADGDSGTLDLSGYTGTHYIYAGMDVTGVEAEEVQAGDFATVWHTNCYVQITATPRQGPDPAAEGTAENPWKVGAEGNEDSILAYVDGYDRILVVRKGDGDPKAFGAGEAPWDDGSRVDANEIVVPAGEAETFTGKWTGYAERISETTTVFSVGVYRPELFDGGSAFPYSLDKIVVQENDLFEVEYLTGSGIEYLEGSRESVTTTVYCKGQRHTCADVFFPSTAEESADRYFGVKLTATGVGANDLYEIGRVSLSLAPGNAFKYVLTVEDEQGTELYSTAAIKICNYNNTTKYYANEINVSPDEVSGLTPTASEMIESWSMDPRTTAFGDTQTLPAIRLAKGQSIFVKVRFYNQADKSLTFKRLYVDIKPVPPASDWAKLQAALTNGEAVSLTCEAFEHTFENGTNFVKLLKDVAADAEVDTCLVIASGSRAVLDLNGKTLDRGLGDLVPDGEEFEEFEGLDDGHVVRVIGHLTMTDTSEAHDGKITGGCGVEAGGVYVYDEQHDNTQCSLDQLDPSVEYARFVLVEGSIVGNGASDSEGCGGVSVFMGAEFIMLGGRIANNVGGLVGGVAILAENALRGKVACRVDLRDGVISGNVGLGSGAVGMLANGNEYEAISIGGTVVITNNIGGYCGGVFSSPGLTLGGSPIIKNNGGIKGFDGAPFGARDLLFCEWEDAFTSPAMSATEPLTEGADIGVGVKSTLDFLPPELPVKFLENASETSAQYFHSEIPNTQVSYNEGALWIVGASAAEGSPENPWKVGAEGAEESVQACTNGNGSVFVKGTGTPKTFGEGEEPWVGAQPPIAQIIIPRGRGDDFKAAWPALAGLIKEVPNYLAFTAGESGANIYLMGTGSSEDPLLETAFDAMGPWTPLAINGEMSEFIEMWGGQTVYFRRRVSNPAETLNPSGGRWKFNFEGTVEATGNIMSLLDKTCQKTGVGEHAFEGLFSSAEGLTSAPELPATTLAESCYQEMFADCSALTNAPALPANKLAKWCYAGMFTRCASLARAPELSATSLSSIQCCATMFADAEKLNAVTVAFKTWNDKTSGTDVWLANVAAHGVFTCPIELPVITDASHIPEGWVVKKRFTLPGPTAAGRYVVSNETSEAVLVEPVGSEPGSDEYEVTVGDTIKIYMLPAEGYEIGGKHPLKLNLTEGVNLKADLPWAVRPIPYQAWDEANKVMTNAVCTEKYEYVTPGTRELRSGWYVVQGCVTNNPGVTIYGDVHLILCDDAELIFEQVDEGRVVVLPGRSLTIYGQTEGTGKLLSQGGAYSAGIGGNNHAAAAGTITINGGLVTAQGGFCAAGIGGGFCGVGGTGGSVTINGGKVLAISNDARGVAGGGGAGIGGSAMGAGGTLTINGGEVTAISYPACETDTDPYYAEGIGSGASMDPSTPLDPGTLDLSGYAGKYYIYAGMDVTGVEAEEVQAGDFATWHTNLYVQITATPREKPAAEGSPEKPWSVGIDGNFLPQAHTNGNGGVIVTGEGLPTSYDDETPAPWADAEPPIETIYVPQDTEDIYKKRWPNDKDKIVGVPDYLSFTAKDGDVKIWFVKSVNFTETYGLEYSFNPLADEWTTLTEFGSGDSPSDTDKVRVANGQTLYIRKTGDDVKLAVGDPWRQGTFKMERVDENGTATVEADGNVMSLLDKTCRSKEVGDYAFYHLFADCSILTTAPKLPATKLGSRCYQYMFSCCSALKAAPKLPAMELADYCYYDMFYRCGSLEAIELPAKNLAPSCYGYMCEYCYKLNAVKVGFDAWPSDGSCDAWLREVALEGTFVCSAALENDFGKKGLEHGMSTIPEGWRTARDYLSFTAKDGDITLSLLKDGTPVDVAFEYSFNAGADVWTTYSEPIQITKDQTVYFRKQGAAVEAISTEEGKWRFVFDGTASVAAGGNVMSLLDPTCHSRTIGEYGLYALFAGCDRLVSAPRIEADTIGAHGCLEMFRNCTALTTAPVVDAEEISGDLALCYMFTSAKALNEMTVGFKDWNGECTVRWVDTVAPFGVFRCPSELEIIVDEGHIPNGWIVFKKFSIPAIEGLKHRVTNSAGEVIAPCAVSQDGTKTYEVLAGDEETYAVHFEDVDGYPVVGEDTLNLGDLSGSVEIGSDEYPLPERGVLLTVGGAPEHSTFTIFCGEDVFAEGPDELTTRVSPYVTTKVVYTTDEGWAYEFASGLPVTEKVQLETEVTDPTEVSAPTEQPDNYQLVNEAADLFDEAVNAFIDSLTSYPPVVKNEADMKQEELQAKVKAIRENPLPSSDALAELENAEQDFIAWKTQLLKEAQEFQEALEKDKAQLQAMRAELAAMELTSYFADKATVLFKSTEDAIANIESDGTPTTAERIKDLAAAKSQFVNSYQELKADVDAFLKAKQQAKTYLDGVQNSFNGLMSVPEIAYRWGIMNASQDPDVQKDVKDIEATQMALKQELADIQKTLDGVQKTDDVSEVSSRTTSANNELELIRTRILSYQIPTYTLTVNVSNPHLVSYSVYAGEKAQDVIVEKVNNTAEFPSFVWETPVKVVYHLADPWYAFDGAENKEVRDFVALEDMMMGDRQVAEPALGELKELVSTYENVTSQFAAWEKDADPMPQNLKDQITAAVDFARASVEALYAKGVPVGETCNNINQSVDDIRLQVENLLAQGYVALAFDLSNTLKDKHGQFLDANQGQIGALYQYGTPEANKLLEDLALLQNDVEFFCYQQLGEVKDAKSYADYVARMQELLARMEDLQTRLDESVRVIAALPLVAERNADSGTLRVIVRQTLREGEESWRIMWFMRGELDDVISRAADIVGRQVGEVFDSTLFELIPCKFAEYSSDYELSDIAAPLDDMAACVIVAIDSQGMVTRIGGVDRLDELGRGEVKGADVIGAEPLWVRYYESKDGQLYDRDALAKPIASSPKEPLLLDQNEQSHYVVLGNCDVDSLVVKGNVNLILGRGCHLSVKNGIVIEEGSILRICSEHDFRFEPHLMGQMSVDKSAVVAERPAALCGFQSSQLQIHGGKVDIASATAGVKVGAFDMLNGEVTVTAGADYAGVDLAYDSSRCLLDAGTLTVTGGAGAAAIGGNVGENGGQFSMNRGLLRANATPMDDGKCGAGIGAGAGGITHGGFDFQNSELRAFAANSAAEKLNLAPNYAETREPSVLITDGGDLIRALPFTANRQGSEYFLVMNQAPQARYLAVALTKANVFRPYGAGSTVGAALWEAVAEIATGARTAVGELTEESFFRLLRERGADSVEKIEIFSPEGCVNIASLEQVILVEFDDRGRVVRMGGVNALSELDGCGTVIDSPIGRTMTGEAAAIVAQDFTLAADSYRLTLTTTSAADNGQAWAWARVGDGELYEGLDDFVNGLLGKTVGEEAFRPLSASELPAIFGDGNWGLFTDNVAQFDRIDPKAASTLRGLVVFKVSVLPVSETGSEMPILAVGGVKNVDQLREGQRLSNQYGEGLERIANQNFTVTRQGDEEQSLLVQPADPLQGGESWHYLALGADEASWRLETINGNLSVYRGATVGDLTVDDLNYLGLSCQIAYEASFAVSGDAEAVYLFKVDGHGRVLTIGLADKLSTLYDPGMSRGDVFGKTFITAQRLGVTRSGDEWTVSVFAAEAQKAEEAGDRLVYFAYADAAAAETAWSKTQGVLSGGMTEVGTVKLAEFPEPAAKGALASDEPFAVLPANCTAVFAAWVRGANDVIVTLGGVTEFATIADGETRQAEAGDSRMRPFDFTVSRVEDERRTFWLRSGPRKANEQWTWMAVPSRVMYLLEQEFESSELLLENLRREMFVSKDAGLVKGVQKQKEPAAIQMLRLMLGRGYFGQSTDVQLDVQDIPADTDLLLVMKTDRGTGATCGQGLVIGLEQLPPGGEKRNQVDGRLVYATVDEAGNRTLHETAEPVELVTELTRSIGGNRWYVLGDRGLYEKIRAGDRLTVNGAANVIVPDGSTSDAFKSGRIRLYGGIAVNAGATLNVYGQQLGNGALQVVGADGCAAIGGDEECGAGTINFHGGIVEAESGLGAAAIGGGYLNGGENGVVNLYGGVVIARAFDAAAIGGGQLGSGCDVVLHPAASVICDVEESGLPGIGGCDGMYDGTVQAFGDKRVFIATDTDEELVYRPQDYYLGDVRRGNFLSAELLTVSLPKDARFACKVASATLGGDIGGVLPGDDAYTYKAVRGDTVVVGAEIAGKGVGELYGFRSPNVLKFNCVQDDVTVTADDFKVAMRRAVAPLDYTVSRDFNGELYLTSGETFGANEQLVWMAVPEVMEPTANIPATAQLFNDPIGLMHDLIMTGAQVGDEFCDTFALMLGAKNWGLEFNYDGRPVALPADARHVLAFKVYDGGKFALQAGGSHKKDEKPSLKANKSDAAGTRRMPIIKVGAVADVMYVTPDAPQPNQVVVESVIARQPFSLTRNEDGTFRLSLNGTLQDWIGERWGFATVSAEVWDLVKAGGIEDLTADMMTDLLDSQIGRPFGFFTLDDLGGYQDIFAQFETSGEHVFTCKADTAVVLAFKVRESGDKGADVCTLGYTVDNLQAMAPGGDERKTNMIDGTTDAPACFVTVVNMPAGVTAHLDYVYNDAWSSCAPDAEGEGTAEFSVPEGAKVELWFEPPHGMTFRSKETVTIESLQQDEIVDASFLVVAPRDLIVPQDLVVCRASDGTFNLMLPNEQLDLSAGERWLYVALNELDSATCMEGEAAPFGVLLWSMGGMALGQAVGDIVANEFAFAMRNGYSGFVTDGNVTLPKDTVMVIAARCFSFTDSDGTDQTCLVTVGGRNNLQSLGESEMGDNEIEDSETLEEYSLVHYLEWDKSARAFVGGQAHARRLDAAGGVIGNGQWYVNSPDDAKHSSETLTVQGTANLVIRDMTALQLRRIVVGEGATLNVYGQSMREGMLMIKDNSMSGAAFGADGVCGTINLHGVQAMVQGTAVGIGGMVEGGELNVLGANLQVSSKGPAIAGCALNVYGGRVLAASVSGGAYPAINDGISLKSTKLSIFSGSGSLTELEPTTVAAYTAGRKPVAKIAEYVNVIVPQVEHVNVTATSIDIEGADVSVVEPEELPGTGCVRYRFERFDNVKLGFAADTGYQLRSPDGYVFFSIDGDRRLAADAVVVTAVSQPPEMIGCQPFTAYRTTDENGQPCCEVKPIGELGPGEQWLWMSCDKALAQTKGTVDDDLTTEEALVEMLDGVVGNVPVGYVSVDMFRAMLPLDRSGVGGADAVIRLPADTDMVCLGKVYDTGLGEMGQRYSNITVGLATNLFERLEGGDAGHNDLGEEPTDDEIEAILKEAFPDPHEVTQDEDGSFRITLKEDMTGPVEIPDNLGPITLDMNGFAITGVNGVNGADGGNALVITDSGDVGADTELTIVEANEKYDADGDIVGGNGADGQQPGNGGAAIRVDTKRGVRINVEGTVQVVGGKGGTLLGDEDSPTKPGAPGKGVDPSGTRGDRAPGSDQEGEVGGTFAPWAKATLAAEAPDNLQTLLPDGVTVVGNELWFWKRVGTNGKAVGFDFTTLDRAWIKDGEIRFVAGSHFVDQFLYNRAGGLAFVGASSAAVVVKPEPVKPADPEEKPVKPVLKAGMLGGKDSGLPDLGKHTTLASTGKSIFQSKDAPVVNGPLMASYSGAPATWRNLAFTMLPGTVIEDNGGAINAADVYALMVADCAFANIIADELGGAIYAAGLNEGGLITNSTFTACSVSDANGMGGAIYASAGRAPVQPGLFGRKFGSDPGLAVVDCIFALNVAESGGAICTALTYEEEEPIAIKVSDTSFVGNFADYNGGAIYAGGKVELLDAEVDRGTFFGSNEAGVYGGALAAGGTEDTFAGTEVFVGSNTVFACNKVENDWFGEAMGGAINLPENCALTVRNALFTNNVARCSGGAVYGVYGGAVCTATGCTNRFEKTAFVDNHAIAAGTEDNRYAAGGAISDLAGVTLVDTCVFDANVVEGVACVGAALDFEFGKETAVVNSTFRRSNVEAVSVYAVVAAEIRNCVIVGNGADADLYIEETSGYELTFTAYGKLCAYTSSAAASSNNFENCVAAEVYRGETLYLATNEYNKVAALGYPQPGVTDFVGVEYGSTFWGTSMGAFETPAIYPVDQLGFDIYVDPLELAWTGTQVQPSTVVVTNPYTHAELTEGVDYTVGFRNNVNSTDKALVVVTGIGNYAGTVTTNYWITSYLVKYYACENNETTHRLLDAVELGSLSGSNVVAMIAPPPGYALDPYHEGSLTNGTVSLYDSAAGDEANGRLVLKVFYAPSGDDDVPDKYQRKITYKVANGWWNDAEDGLDRTVWVTLFDADGKWSETGIGKLTDFPSAGQKPFSGYAKAGVWYSDPPTVEMPISHDTPSLPFFLYVYCPQPQGGTGRGGRGSSGSVTQADLGALKSHLVTKLTITDFAYVNGKAAGEARAAVVDELTGQTILDELLRRTKIDILATPSLDKGEWSVIGSPTTDGEGGWGTDERPAAETPAQMFFKLRLR